MQMLQESRVNYVCFQFGFFSMCFDWHGQCNQNPLQLRPEEYPRFSWYCLRYIYIYTHIFHDSMEATYPLPTRTRHCLSSFIFRTSFPWTVGDGFVFCEGYPTAALKEQHLIWGELNLIWGGRCGTFSIARLAGFCKGIVIRLGCDHVCTVAPSCPKKCCQS